MNEDIDYSIVIKPPKNSGRTGNQISLCAYAFLYSIHTGTDFTNIYKIDPPLFPPNYIENDDQPISLPELRKYRQTVKEGFPQDVRLFQNYRDILQNFFLPDSCPESDSESELDHQPEVKLKEPEYDITIHIRTDDIGNSHNSYTALPFSFYKEALNNIINSDEKRGIFNKHYSILIVCKKPHDFFTEQILHTILKGIERFKIIKKNREYNRFTVNVHSESLKEDFQKMLESNIYISSISTLSFWAGFLGPYCKEIHVPLWGLFTANGGTGVGNLHLEEWKSTPETKIVLHKINTEKITLNNMFLL